MAREENEQWITCCGLIITWDILVEHENKEGTGINCHKCNGTHYFSKSTSSGIDSPHHGGSGTDHGGR